MFRNKMGGKMADVGVNVMAQGRKKSGRHPEKALSAAFVRNAPPGKHFDGHGLYLKVEASGARRWIQRINIRQKRTEIGIGSASLVSLADARQAALENRRLARAGGDPLQAQRQAKEIPTFEEAARKVHKIHEPSWKSKKHAAQFITTLETYAFPHFGKLRVGEVTPSDVLRALTPIWLEKEETSRRVRQRIGLVMKWAIAQGWRTDNPADQISEALPRQSRKQKPRRSLPYRDVARCVAKVSSSQASISTKLAFEFLVLTACRSNEVRGARWEEIDLDEATWIIPENRMKAKVPHRVPLTQRTIKLLQHARRLDDLSGLVFPGSIPGKPLSDATLRKIVVEQGFDVDVHGFRSSFRTWCQECTNAPREVAEAALAHKTRDKVEAAYARSDLFDKRRDLMRQWEQFIAS